MELTLLLRDQSCTTATHLRQILMHCPDTSPADPCSTLDCRTRHKESQPTKEANVRYKRLRGFASSNYKIWCRAACAVSLHRDLKIDAAAAAPQMQFCSEHQRSFKIFIGADKSEKDARHSCKKKTGPHPITVPSKTVFAPAAVECAR
jgi:hypothetical protein